MIHKNWFFVNPIQLGICIATTIASLIFGISLVFISLWGSSMLFFSIAILFALVSTSCGAILTITDEGVTRSVFGITTKMMTWEEIKEIGVAGTDLFNKSKKDKTDTLQIYFSKSPLTDEERFDMMLQWPPKDGLYLQYTKARTDVIQAFWSNKIQTYNTGEILL